MVPDGGERDFEERLSRHILSEARRLLPVPTVLLALMTLVLFLWDRSVDRSGSEISLWIRLFSASVLLLCTYAMLRFREVRELEPLAWFIPVSSALGMLAVFWVLQDGFRWGMGGFNLSYVLVSLCAVRVRTVLAVNGGLLTLSVGMMWLKGIEQTVFLSNLFYSLMWSTVGVVTAAMLEAIYRRAYRLQERLEYESRTDALTGTLNRRALREEAAQRLEESVRLARPVSLLALDLDHFKRINDHFGHPVGDEILQQFVRLVRHNLRPYDLLGRMGGEEFVVLLPGTVLEEALLVAERIRLGVERELRSSQQPEASCTVSIGVAEHWEDTPSVDHLLGSADEALYAAKGGGRNRVSAGRPISELER